MTRGKMVRKQIEILAPAGSYESFRAAVQAGADAVYAGGPRFGARAFADNFTQEKLLEAIDYAHLHGRKFYLTVNTLLKNTEIKDLYAYLEPLYRQGLDAVIVQDVGVLEFVRTYFPEMAIHASTQMTITNAEGALFLKEQGVERVVPARELSLKEVREIADRTGMEVECFVHGALCYCYSGQCLLSSLIGGRSGNRGQCAQPCRLPYTVAGKKEYVLSLKDICTLELIPKLAEAGIDSFKIEGRMKKPEYVALVTSMYRKYTDLYLQKGQASFRVTEQDKEMLMDIYNRGGFGRGYYEQTNGRDMLSLKRPNHAGVPAVKVVSQNGRELTGQTLTQIHKGDLLELSVAQENGDSKDNYTFGKSVLKGELVQILVPKKKRYAKGTILYRLRNQELLDDIQNRYGNGIIREPVKGHLEVRVGEPAKLTVTSRGVSVAVEADEATDEAKNQPLDEARLKKQLQKTGNTGFYFEALDVTIEGSIFLPMQRINELRRLALELLEKEITSSFRRKIPDENPLQEGVLDKNHGNKGNKGGQCLAVLVETKEQLRVVMSSADITRVYIDSNISMDFLDDKEIKLLGKAGRENGKEIFLAMPHIFRKPAVTYFTNKYEQFLTFGFDGVLVRNYESFHFLKEQGFDKKIILDHNLYVFNHSAKHFWRRQSQKLFTAPVELNERELRDLGMEDMELIVYGRLPVMVTAQCMTKTMERCTGKPQTESVKDRYQKGFPVKNCCSFCYNVIYNTSPVFLADLKEAVSELCPSGLRIQFTTENAQETTHILSLCGDIYRKEVQINPTDIEFTRGHFKRGIT